MNDRWEGRKTWGIRNKVRKAVREYGHLYDAIAINLNHDHVIHCNLFYLAKLEGIRYYHVLDTQIDIITAVLQVYSLNRPTAHWVFFCLVHSPMLLCQILGRWHTRKGLT